MAPLRCVKGVWVSVGLHLLQDDRWANGHEVTVVIVGEGVAAHLALQSACGIVCRPKHRGSWLSRWGPIQVDEHQDGSIFSRPPSSAGISYVTSNTELWKAVRLNWEGEEIFKNKFKEPRKADRCRSEKKYGKNRRKGRNCWKENAIMLSEKGSKRRYHFYSESTKIVRMNYRWNVENTEVHSRKAPSILTTIQLMLRE